jgi:nucleotide-binding universal stress UspA family protein
MTTRAKLEAAGTPKDAVGATGARRVRRLLVAVDAAGETADAPVDTALALARLHGAKTRALSVVNPFSPAWSIAAPPDAVAGAFALRAEQRQRRVALRRYLSQRPDTANWVLRVPLGSPADTIIAEAQRDGADLVVIGARPHSLIERLVQGTTALRVIRESPVPVMAATSHLHAMPRSVLVAVDFSHASVLAIRTACTIFTGCHKLVLVHVQSELDAALEPGDDTARATRSEGLRSAFQQLIGMADIPANVVVDTVALRGGVPEQLAAYAERSGADVLVAARKGHSLAERMLAASVTATLVRRAPCSLLIIPPEAATESSRRARRSE